VQEALKNLLNLQNADRALGERRARLAEFPTRLAQVEAALGAAQAHVERARAAQLRAVMDRKTFELEVEKWKEQSRKYKDQSSQVKTNETYKALQHEIDMAEGKVRQAEDRMLEEMVASEDHDREIQRAQKELAEAQASAKAARAVLEAERSESEKEVAKLESERAALLPGIPEDLQEHYERLAGHLKGVALAQIKDEACTMCGSRVRPHIFQKMRRDSVTDIFHCELCTRMLYYIEPQAEAASFQAAESGKAPEAANHTN
jgi:predicted  nucleic acid-binding Zn-ribbon protein